ncbi:hypothetical protein [Tepidimonas sp.]|uniref:hypothetical protein n=1 Tax=Tepidimonas sp. TaxID=2002775 RepID=UPI0028CE3888|nr:hypothetical protein [Tepidimonas sp.]MDT7929242.1 hypothetical protein [Tepidimonas sp.]
MGEFVTALQRTELGRDGAAQLPQLLRVARYADQAVEQAEEAAEALAPWPAVASGVPRLELAAFRQRAQALLTPLQGDVADDPAALEAALTEAEDAYAVLKDALLRAGAQGALSLDAMDAWLRAISELRRGLQQMTKGALLLADLGPGHDRRAAG